MLDKRTQYSSDGITKSFYETMKVAFERTGSIHLYFNGKDKIEAFYKLLNQQLGVEITRLPAQESLYYSRFAGYKLAIMYSGGLDSAIAYEYAQKVYKYKKEEIVAIHVNYGAPYQEAEQVIWKKRRSGIERCIEVNLTKDLMNEQDLEKGYIIPFRNSLFAAIGSYVSNAVWIIAHYRQENKKDAGVSDKSVAFFNTISETLSRLREEPIKVWSPFQHISKADSIIWAMENIPKKRFDNLLTNTITCYNPIIDGNKIKNCGRCYTCYKLWKSFKVVGIESSNFKNNPAKDPKSMEYEQRERNKGR